MAQKQKLTSEIINKAKKVKLLLMDCDGVLTDGSLYFSKDGEELKVFNVKDGQGIVSLHKKGFQTGIITGRKSLMLERRAKELKIHYLKQASKDKVSDFNLILSKANVESDEVAYIGDDIPDIDLLKKVGFPIAVADSTKEIFEYVLYTTRKKGGKGAVREVTDILIKSRE